MSPCFLVRFEIVLTCKIFIEAFPFKLIFRALKQFNLDKDDLDFFFGRPLKETIVAFGLAVDEQPDGSFLLRPIEEEERDSNRKVQ